MKKITNAWDMRRFFENPLVFFWASRFSDISLDERIYSNKLNYATGPRRFLYYLFFYGREGWTDLLLLGVLFVFGGILLTDTILTNLVNITYRTMNASS